MLLFCLALYVLLQLDIYETGYVKRDFAEHAQNILHINAVPIWHAFVGVNQSYLNVYFG